MLVDRNTLSCLSQSSTHLIYQVRITNQNLGCAGVLAVDNEVGESGRSRSVFVTGSVLWAEVSMI